MTTRQRPRFDRLRRSVTVTTAVVLASVLTGAGGPAPARADVPEAARTWSALMYRSLTASATIAQLQKTLTTQRATVTTRLAAVSRARTADGAARTRLTAAATAGQVADARSVAAAQTLAEARKTLSKVSKQKPRNAAAYTRAKNAVTAATKAVDARRTAARDAATALKTARAGARTAAAGLTSATAAWNAANVAVTQTQQRIAGVGSPAGLAGQATAVARDAVTQVRPGFVLADTTDVEGVTVHKIVAFAFRQMIDDAKAAGVQISGGGFRTKQRQIELRKINGCPDIWTAPASSCRVPTAIPGRSLHEIGLAVDITSGGRTIDSKSAAFKWLSAHAAKYGFVNLPSEAWHWSITGG